MAPSFLNNLRAGAGAGALALAVALGAGAQTDGGERTEELEFGSESLTFDRQTNLIELKAPQITQGDLRIVADQALATGIDVDTASEWRLTGRVRITIDGAVIEADSAVFTFEQRRLSRGELLGAPVSFSDADEARQTAIHGRANKMSYDYVTRTLRMSENAWVQKDKLEIQGCDLIYDFMAERVTSGSADCADLFRVRRLPDDQAPSAAPLQ